MKTNSNLLKRRHIIRAGLALPLAASVSVPGFAQEPYPSRPIKFILPFSAGGGTDEFARALADELQKELKTPVVSENKPGGSGTIAVRTVTAAPADGYTVLIASNSLAAVNPVTMKDLSYDPFKDIEPIHGIVVAAPVVCGPTNSPYKSLKEALLASKASGKALRIGNYSKGYELLASWLGQLEGISVIHVPYRGPSQMLVDLIGGQLDFTIGDPTSAMELIRAGRVRGFAIGSDKREPALPDVPTVKELGYPQYESYVWVSVYVKAGTPPEIKKRLADAVAIANKAPSMSARRAGRPEKSLDLALDALGKFQREEYERFKRVAESTGFKPS